MKRILFLFFSSCLLVLSACGNADIDNASEDDKSNEEVEEQQEKQDEIQDQEDESESEEDVEEVSSDDSEDDEQEESEEGHDETYDINVEDAKELLAEEALGENDEIIDLTVEDGEIKAIIKVASDDTLFAETIYSRAGDAFLEHDGWDILTIEFSGIGKVSMHRDEKETNEYGLDYFPTEKIMEQLEN